MGLWVGTPIYTSCESPSSPVVWLPTVDRLILGPLPVDWAYYSFNSQLVLCLAWTFCDASTLLARPEGEEMKKEEGNEERKWSRLKIGGQ